MKRLITIVLTAAFLALMAVPAFANDGTVIMYTTTSTPAYVSPNAGSKVLAVFQAGKRITTYPGEDQNGFKHCFTNETEFCYIPAAFLTTSSSGSTEPAPVIPETGTERVVMGTTNYLALRSEPSRKASCEIGKLYNGEYFFVKEFRTDGFAYGRTRGGKYGYVVSDYLEVPGAVSNTYYAGHDWSPVYNYEYYRNNNPDVVSALGTSEAALISHFVNHGIYEGRQGRADWNVYNYMNQHPDYVKLFGNDLSAYYKIAVGIRP